MMQLQDPQYKTPDGAALRVWRDAALNRFLTEKLGREVFDDVIYVEVIAPGSGNSTPVFEVERVFDANMNYVNAEGENVMRGPKYEELKQFIEDFKKNQGTDASLSGTPLEQWPEMNRSLVATLKAQGVYTVDALSALPDARLIIVGPDGRAWREKAAAYIANAKDGAYATALAATVEQLNVDIANGKEREAALAQRIAELESAGTDKTPAPVKTKPGKSVADAVAEVAAQQTSAVVPMAIASEGETLVAKSNIPII